MDSRDRNEVLNGSVRVHKLKSVESFAICNKVGKETSSFQLLMAISNTNAIIDGRNILANAEHRNSCMEKKINTRGVGVGG